MKKMICTDCFTIARPLKKKKGNMLLGLVLTLFFILPGVLYLMWMFSGRKVICRSCGHESLVPLDSPRGKKLAAGV